ncbi:Phosphate regulon transcriptional regulatory protein PhoB [bioreactor metagenome]|jgi:Response regulators consisting of a CheY-like receiver domain and a winged-helix DNA-binding domain|uniref:DNA-binding response regulator n=2 Tax=root TaxID=1 RepID=A0AB33HUG0_9CHLR|nr:MULTISPECIES: response regulator transcription factor [Dehalococcoides]MBF4481745.1 response regulator transcription factor [Dehalococcoides mccartyi]MBJ7531503.1 response regulator transcription factor [Dehalococcoides mccartyi]MEA4878848.1 response regulator transcription factor [Dehalococcoides mccartyi]POZ59448.1 Phosphate regulon transcriptional regulatory protein PhoB (SphR) [Dehalococcoides mccartyi]BAZ97925.1 DNA-binding response regulator [Dehalococcoides mccartyi]
MAARILIVEDDAKTVELVRLYLARDGYRVLAASDGITGLNIARQNKPDLIILDIMLPGMNGIEICRQLRLESGVPVIMLTAKTSDDDKLAGLDTGADDYITKPFSPRELAARVRAILRRLPGTRTPEIIKCGQLTLDFTRHQVTLNGAGVKLTAVELKLLGAMAAEPGRVFSRSQLIEQALGYDFDGFDRTIDVHIGNLRRKLRLNKTNTCFIQTIYGAGYRFVCEPEI